MSAWDELPSLDAAARRALPSEDASIDALDRPSRELLAGAWAERARSELGAGAVFAAISQGLFAAGAPAEIQWLAARAVCDEMRHAEICRFMAVRYGGADVARPRAPAIGDPPRSALVYAVLNGSINETIASAVLTACHEEAESPLARAATRELLCDEVDHARVGWALLGEGPLAAGLRCEVASALPALVRLVRDRWLARAAELPEDLPRGHGCLPRADVAQLVDHALRVLVLPGFAHVGIDPGPALDLLQR
ncbi:hypothetical protein [Polyangium aurulentum]|uniref:hypothetical protein n=1 Tax=Polyangium aurulentum TaxID=2567896 RepID=UPI0010ADB65F|nr:hypothetical protein [Polyangium aurulentum]UQA57536.1 hypothetical protein E8A73_040685 [Polyangium aurulentum]